MKTVALHNLGRFGNLLFRYSYARALCEQNGYELRTQPWVGERIFTLGDWPTRPRPTGTEDIVIDEYRQAQKDMIYTRADCRRWFALKPEIEAKLAGTPYPAAACAHFRRGDYVGSSYPLISRRAVLNSMEFFGIEPAGFVEVSEEFPCNAAEMPAGLEMLPDFYRLMRAPVLFRANSSFSWWAATLGHGRVFSPLITGFAGGIEHDNVPYVEGNWPRLCELEFVTDLYLKES